MPAKRPKTTQMYPRSAQILRSRGFLTSFWGFFGPKRGFLALFPLIIPNMRGFPKNPVSAKTPRTEQNDKIPVAVTRLDDGSTDYTYDCCYYPAVGMCVLQLSVNPRVSKTYEHGTTYSLYEIAEGYRPSRSAALYCYSSGSAVSNAAINSAGTIRYQPKVSDVQPSTTIQMSGFWFV